MPVILRLTRAVFAIAVSAIAVRPVAAEPHHRVGVMVDAGLPDGANASLVYRPVRWLRLHGGAGYNLISTGVRAGASLVPLDWAVSPSLVIEAGRYVSGDANPLAQRFTGDPDYDSPVLREVGYDYANAHVGLEFGGTRGVFYVHAGMSYVTADVQHADEALGDDGGARFGRDPHVSGLVPSGRLGFILYLF